MLVGDLNGHSEVWGCSDTNDRGEIMEDVIPENDLCLLNEKQPTYLHPPTGNYYAIDLSLCHPNIYLDFDWSVCDDLHGSDHFPILIKEIESSDVERTRSLNAFRLIRQMVSSVTQQNRFPMHWVKTFRKNLLVRITVKNFKI